MKKLFKWGCLGVIGFFIFATIVGVLTRNQETGNPNLAIIAPTVTPIETVAERVELVELPTAAENVQLVELPTVTPTPEPTYTSVPVDTPTTAPTDTPSPVSTAIPTDTPVPLPTDTVAPTPVPTAPICSNDAYKCDDFQTWGEAQGVFDFCRAAGANDIHRLDQNNDGIVCEDKR